MSDATAIGSSASLDELEGPARLGLLLKMARIVVIDDEESNLQLVARLLGRDGYSYVTGLKDARHLEAQLAAATPDLVITDLHMPGRDGFGVIDVLQPLIRESRLPVLVVSGDATIDARNRALAMGARDFVSKPFDATELALRVRNQLESRMLFLDVRKQNRTLRDAVTGRTEELEGARVEMLRQLATAAEYRDDCTAQHTARVGILAGHLAVALALDEAAVAAIRHAAPLHDVGKIGVPDELLRKPGRLTPEEVAVMRTHTTIGADILRHGEAGILQMAREIALTHHEWWDGHGYPRGLAGTAIPLAGRIVAVADTYDAITNERPYRASRTSREAVAEIVDGSGTQFEPAVVDALLRVRAAGLLERIGADATKEATRVGARPRASTAA